MKRMYESIHEFSLIENQGLVGCSLSVLSHPCCIHLRQSVVAERFVFFAVCFFFGFALLTTQEE